MSAARRAVVIGAAGQDGSYLTELLVEKGYDVTGVIRRDPADRIPNLDGVRDRIALVQADLGDAPRLEKAIRDFKPDEIYNLASVSFGPDAWSDPVLTAELGTVALTALLETIRASPVPARFFQASSAWVFGQPEHSPQNEQTPYAPSEPYGAAKAFGDFLVRAYRARYGLFACSALFYNHESPRRPERFVTRKITRAAAAIKLGLESEVVLGDIDAARDWGYAKDFVAAVWAMLQADEPEDYVIATGEPHTVRELIELAFSHVGLDWEQYATFNPSLHRGGGQVANLVGDSSKLRKRLGWRPSVSFEELVRLMVDADLAELSR